MTQQLKPCPFCGTVPEITISGNLGLFVCSGSPCAGSGLWTGFLGEDEETAVATWNRRVVDAGHLAAKGAAIACIANAAYRLIDATSTFDHPDMPAHVAKDYVKRMEYPETALRAALSMFNCRPGSALTKRDRAKLLHGLARQLSAEAYAERPMPEHWEVGQKVRYLRDKEWCSDAGETGVIVAVSDECAEKPAYEYQVFWTLPDKYKNRGARFWTTPGDVELVK